MSKYGDNSLHNEYENEFANELAESLEAKLAKESANKLEKELNNEIINQLEHKLNDDLNDIFNSSYGDAGITQQDEVLFKALNNINKQKQNKTYLTSNEQTKTNTIFYCNLCNYCCNNHDKCVGHLSSATHIMNFNRYTQKQSPKQKPVLKGTINRTINWIRKRLGLKRV